jgi:hypothetical protein
MLREAKLRVEVNKEFLEKDGTLLNEGVQQELTGFLKDKGVDKETINNILQAFRGSLINKIINKIIDRVDKGNKEMEEALFSSIRMSKATVAQKVDVLRKMLKTSIIDFTKLKALDSHDVNLLDLFSDEINSYPKEERELFINIGKSLINKKVSKVGEGSTGTGKGEIFLAVFGKGTLNCRGGDICLDNNPIEVKGSNGRISTIGGKSLFANWKKEDFEKVFFKYGVSKVPSNQSEVKKLWDKNNLDKQAIYNTLKEFYFDKLLISDISKNVKEFIPFLDTEDFKNFKSRLDSYVFELGKLTFDYYQKKEGFCCLLSLYEEKGKLRAKMFNSYKDLTPKNVKTMGLMTNGNNTNYIVIN